jgi:hypothetical protein
MHHLNLSRANVRIFCGVMYSGGKWLSTENHRKADKIFAKMK